MIIGVMDSGIGGLNVLHEFRKKFPNNTYIYYGDTIHLPYGNKSKEDMICFSKKIINFFEEKNCDLIIIACGTISSNCYLELKKFSTIPILDIVSNTLNYINKSSFKNIAVFATENTIKSNFFQKNSSKRITGIACPDFVPMIENRSIDNSIISKYCSSLENTDAIILGCTHYPILSKNILSFLPNVSLIDMGKVLVASLDLENSSFSHTYLYFSKLDENIYSNALEILESFDSIECLILK